MDLLTQGVLGAAAAQSCFGKKLPRASALIGFVAGLLADADVFIRPASDPLGGLTYHRHFTHALAFIPIGALIAALPFLLVPSLKKQFRLVYLCALVAYATHGLLDTCTSYGTMLLWPFSDERISWDLIAIIDPAFTLPLIVGLIIACWKRKPLAVRIALALSITYMGFAFVQHERAIAMQRELAAMRGQTIERGRVFPTPLSLLLWRSVYHTPDGLLVADGVHLPYLSEAKAKPGSATAKITLDAFRAQHVDDEKLIAGFERFLWFTDGYAAAHPDDPQVIGDMRYCIEPQTFDSLWGFYIDVPETMTMQGRSTRMVSLGLTRSDRFTRAWDAMMGRDPAFETLANVKANLKP